MENKLVKKCPNCGASIEHNYNHKCPYCRTNLHMTDEEIKKINNCDIRIDRVDIERNPLRHGFIITIYGWSTPKFHYLEEINNDNFVVSGSDIGKRIGYRMEVPMEVIYSTHFNFDQIIKFIDNSIPPELYNSYNKQYILQQCIDYFHERNCL